MRKTLSAQRKKAAILLTILLAVTLVALACRRDNDYFDYTIQGVDFSVDPEECAAIDDDYGILKVVNDTGTEVIVKAENLLLTPGTYDYDFQYELDGEPVTWILSSGSYLYEDNQCGKLFAELALDPDASALYGTFELDQQVNDLCVYISVPQGAVFSIGRLTLTSQTPTSTDSLVFMGLAAIVYAVLLWALLTRRELCRPAEFCGVMLSGRRVWFVLLLIFTAVTIWASAPLFASDLSGGYDMLYHVNRIEGLARSLACGQFPVRIHAGLLNGYGYPNGLFYPELFLYFPAVLRILGMSLMNCYKVLSVTCTFATAVLGYLSFSRLLNSRMAGLLAAVLYTLNPYRLACVYERSALGEYLAMTFLPMVLYGLYALLFGKKQDWKWLCLGATGVLQSHILTTEIAAAVCALAVLICVRRLFTRERRWIEFLKTAAACVLLNFWFLIPFALMSLQLNVAVFTRDPQLSINAIRTMQELFSMVFVLILRPNDSGVGNNGFGFVNLFALALFVVYLLVFVGVRKMDAERRRLVRLGSVMALGALALGFAATDLFPWAEIQSVHWISKLVGALQFPFRLFSVMMLFFAVLTGVVLLLWTRTAPQRAAAALLAVAFAAFSANIYLDYAVEYTAIPHMATQSEFKLKTSTSDCVALAEYVSGASSIPDLFGRGTAVTTSDASITVTGVHRNGTSVSFDYTIEAYQEGGDYYVLAPLTYYPGYTARINGVDCTAVAGGANYVRIDLPAAAGHVELSYQDPTTFAAANAVSVLTAAFLIVSWAKPELLRGAAARLRRKRA